MSNSQGKSFLLREMQKKRSLDTVEGMTDDSFKVDTNMNDMLLIFEEAMAKIGVQTTEPLILKQDENECL